MFQLAGQMFFGLIVGTVARLMMPSRSVGSLFLAAFCGLLGSLVGTILGHAAFGEQHNVAAWLTAGFGAITALALYHRAAGRRAAYERKTLPQQQ